MSHTLGIELRWFGPQALLGELGIELVMTPGKVGGVNTLTTSAGPGVT